MAKPIDYKFCPQCRRPMTKRDGNPYCEHCDITVYSNVAGGASIMLIKDGKVLLTRRGREPMQGTFDIPGGFIEPGETAEEAAIREVKEETGLDAEITGILGVYSDHYEYDTYTLGAHYLGKVVGGALKAGDDASDLEWVSIEDLPPEALDQGFQNVRRSLRDLQAWYHSQNAH